MTRCRLHSGLLNYGGQCELNMGQTFSRLHARGQMKMLLLAQLCSPIAHTICGIIKQHYVLAI